MSSAPSSATGVQSLERVFSLLALLADHHAYGMSMRQLIQSTGLSRPTLHRMMSFLLRRHYAEQDPKTQAYRLGTAAMLLGLRTMSRPPLVQTYLPTMRRLTRRTGEGVFLVVGIGDYSYNLHLEQNPPENPNLRSLVGESRLLGLGISSLALLAAMSDTEIRQHFDRHTAEYVANGLNVARILSGIERTRHLGYTLAAGFGVAGAGYAFEVPLSGLAAISVVSPRVRMPMARRHEIAMLIAEEVEAQRRLTTDGA